MSLDAPVSTAIARELRAALARRRMSHAELARAGDMSEGTVNRALRGESTITVDTFVRMVDALDGGHSDLAGRMISEIRRRSHRAVS